MLLKFSAHGVLGKSKGNEDSFEPWGIASNDSGSIVVTDHNNHQILVRIKLIDSVSKLIE